MTEKELWCQVLFMSLQKLTTLDYPNSKVSDVLYFTNGIVEGYKKRFKEQEPVQGVDDDTVG